MSDEPKQWWQTLPAIVGGSATLITAITGLLVVLNQMGVFKPADKKPTPPAETAVSPQPPPSGSRVDSFVGHWKNENPDSSGITKADIDSRLDRIIVRMWGKCHPTDCD